MPEHSFFSIEAIICSIPGMQFVGCCLRPAFQPFGCLLLTQNGVLSQLILHFEIEGSCKVRDQASKEVVA